MQKNLLYATALVTLLVPCVAASKIVTIESDNDFNRMVNSKQPMVLKFASDWCHVCKSVATPFEKVSNELEFKNVLFVHVNADKVKQASKTYGIVGVPTFIYIKDGAKKDQVIGVENVTNFENDLRKHIQTTWAPELTQNTATVKTKEKAMTLDEIAAEGIEKPAMQPTQTEKPAEEASPAPMGVLGNIKYFFVSLFIKIKYSIMWLINKIAFWQK